VLNGNTFAHTSSLALRDAGWQDGERDWTRRNGSPVRHDVTNRGRQGVELQV
jgi:hypothetical protein